MNHTPDLLIICIGSVKDRHCAAMIADFEKRLRFEARLEVTELKDSGKANEGKRIGELLDKHRGTVYALGEEGSQYSSRAFAAQLAQSRQKTVFILGGPDGLCETIKKRADKLLSLASGTFTHEMARLFLTEQLYRACTILHNRKYHRD